MGAYNDNSRAGCVSSAGLKALYLDDLYNKLCNAIILKGLPQDVPERWVKDLLFKDGQMFVYKDMYLRVNGNNGRFVYGEPTKLILTSPDRTKTYQVDTSAGAWIRANHLATPNITQYLEHQAGKLAELEVTLAQNIIASRRADILSVPDKKFVLSLKNALEEQKLGSPVIFGDQDFFDTVKTYNLSVTFEGDRINDLLRQVYRETLEHVGIITPSNKRERVNNGEVQSESVLAYDNIYTVIDSVNRDAERGGIPFRIEFNGTLDEYIENADGVTYLEEQENG